MKARVEYTCDADDGDNQSGRIIVTLPSGRIEGTWSAEGGMGDGCELVRNTTDLTDEEADDLIGDPEICQGIGEFEIEIERDHTREPGIGCWEFGDVIWVE